MTDATMPDADLNDLIDIDVDELDLDDLELAAQAEEERTSPERPCGDPLAHDRLLAVLRRCHPQGHENVAEPARRLPRWQASRMQVSLTGCSASLCADAA